VWLPDEILTHYSAAADSSHPAAAPRAATVRSPAFVPARVDQSTSQPGPAWSARGPQATVQAERAAARLSDAGRPDASGGDLGVVVPQAESQVTMRRLPIFDEVESRWSQSTREASGPVGLAAAAGPPAGGLPTGGLPRRPLAGTQASRTVQGLPLGAPNRPGTTGRDGSTAFQRGAGQSRTAPPDEGNPGGSDES
ncbi:MAG TPA: hypothetical protein VJ351_04180, partial [Streptosporangiaceae bacterium]|nr:hypothetical protein [Streptosporangiaceae bacterium]